jgi:drug/metabolite transporter (DMT)-like permease
MALAAAGAIGFSGKAIIVKLAYRHGVDAVTLIMFRMLFALPLFAALAWWSGRGRAPLTLREWLACVGLGFSGYYLSSMLDFMGLAYISASLERLILYLGPTLAMGLSVVWLKRHIGRRQWLAAAVSYAGVVIVCGHEWSAQGDHVLLGTGLVFASAVSYAIYMIASGEWVHRLGALRLTGVASSFACAMCLLQFLLLRPLSAAAVPEPVIWLSVLNATFCTFAPVLLVMLAIEHIGATLTAQIGLIGPLSTIAMSVVLLGEPFTPVLFAGTALVLAGIMLLARWR